MHPIAALIASAPSTPPPRFSRLSDIPDDTLTRIVLLTGLPVSAIAAFLTSSKPTEPPAMRLFLADSDTEIEAVHGYYTTAFGQLLAFVTFSHLLGWAAVPVSLIRIKP